MFISSNKTGTNKQGNERETAIIKRGQGGRKVKKRMKEIKDCSEDGVSEMKERRAEK